MKTAEQWLRETPIGVHEYSNLINRIQLDAAKWGAEQAAKIPHLGTCDGFPYCGSPICDRNDEIHKAILTFSQQLTIESLPK